MAFIAYIIAVIIVLILWYSRPFVSGAVFLVVFYLEELFHKKKADRIVHLFEKLDAANLTDDETKEAIKPFRRKFLGLKLFGFIFMIVYAYISALIIYFLIPIWWLFWIVFFGTIILNWSIYVTNISLRYLIFHESRMSNNS